MNILSYVEHVPQEIANAALFYCYRAFNAIAWPKEMRPDFFFDAPSCIPSAEVQALTMAILSGIEEQERRPLDEIDKQTLAVYEREIGDVGDLLMARLPDIDVARGEQILREMGLASLTPQAVPAAPAPAAPSTTKAKSAAG
ncbi:hypothetical protein GJ699_19890 [Duganella sp. FT80W]|uniref:Uncharacterized protein n=1 Tax=Duganella guangzhouensis TaxID=2666084 RepID=A0A6I2L3E7_9BURK|nr:hypothetical protein [Duganella guangzhouensis]MRW92260.1 hypothetical protein [Duganella guangzhouensis]